jgi:hypothetical protein
VHKAASPYDTIRIGHKRPPSTRMSRFFGSYVRPVWVDHVVVFPADSGVLGRHRDRQGAVAVRPRPMAAPPDEAAVHQSAEIDCGTTCSRPLRK